MPWPPAAGVRALDLLLCSVMASRAQVWAGSSCGRGRGSLGHGEMAGELDWESGSPCSRLSVGLAKFKGHCSLGRSWCPEVPWRVSLVHFLRELRLGWGLHNSQKLPLVGVSPFISSILILTLCLCLGFVPSDTLSPFKAAYPSRSSPTIALCDAWAHVSPWGLLFPGTPSCSLESVKDHLLACAFFFAIHRLSPWLLWTVAFLPSPGNPA